MALFDRWRRRRRPMEEHAVSALRFVGDQDGEVERQLKRRLTDLFRPDPDIRSAYLARVENGGETGVMLCIAKGSPDPALARDVGTIFADIFSSREHLDILFLDSAQEAEVRRVCTPFYLK